MGMLTTETESREGKRKIFLLEVPQREEEYGRNKKEP